MEDSFWNKTYSVTVPTNLVVGVMLLLAAALLVWLLVRWRENHPEIPLTKTPWRMWYPALFCLLSGLYMGGYGIIEML